MKLYLAGEHSVKNGALALTFDGLVSRRHTDSQGRESDSVRRERESMNLYLAQISTHEGVWRSTHTHKICTYTSQVITRSIMGSRL